MGPIIAKCLEGMKVAAEAVDAKNVGASAGSRGGMVKTGKGGTPELRASALLTAPTHPYPARTPSSS